MAILKNTKVIFLFILVSIVSVVYYAGLSGVFYFDDEWNILRNSVLHINELSLSSLERAADSGQSGPLGRPIAMVSFAVNHYFSGFDPFFFKLTNLVIHLLAGVGVFFLALGLTQRVASLSTKQSEQLALLVSAFWLLHPLNLTPVLYVVQRMTGLSALFCFVGLACYVYGRLRLLHDKPNGFWLIISGFLVFLPLGLFSKESAALFPLYCFLIEVIFFRFTASDSRTKTLLVGLFSATLIIPFFFASAYIVIKPEWILSGYVHRDFGLIERLLTESRVLVFYLKQIVLPVNAELGLFHDDIAISTSLFNPIITLLSIILNTALIATALIFIKRFPVYSFGVLFFFSAHLIESTVISLELVHEHRNYVASFSILFLIAYGLIVLSKHSSLVKLSYALIFIAVFYLGFSTFLRASVWGNPALHPFEELRNHPESPRINYHVGKIFAAHGHQQEDAERQKISLEKAAKYFEKSADLNNSYTDGLFGLLMLESIEGVAMKDKYRQLLYSQLSSGVFNANNYNYLSSYFKCINDRVCKVNPRGVDSLIAACKENPNFVGKHSRNILRLYANYKTKALP